MITKFGGKCAAAGTGARLGLFSRSFRSGTRPQGGGALRWQQSPPQQTQVRQCVGGIPSHRGMDGLLSAGASDGATAVDKAPVVVQRLPGTASVDPARDAGGLVTLPMALVPTGVVGEHFALRPAPQLVHLRAIAYVRRRVVNDAAQVGIDSHTNL
jgi:hypothetical protein